MATLNITATIKFVEHPDPKRLTDLWANIALKEILKREAAEKSGQGKELM